MIKDFYERLNDYVGKRVKIISYLKKNPSRWHNKKTPHEYSGVVVARRGRVLYLEDGEMLYRPVTIFKDSEITVMEEEGAISDEEIENWKKEIDKMSRVEMARLKRFAPVGHPVFREGTELPDYFERRFKELGGMSPEISKQILWV